MNDQTITDDLDKIWIGDLLDRRQQAELLYKFMQNRPHAASEEGYVLNLDTGWGEGKTYFLRRLQKQLEHLNHPCVLIDAWKNDHVVDPLIMVMSSIEGRLKKLAGEDTDFAISIEKMSATGFRILGAVAKGLTKTAIRKLIGEGLEEVTEIFQSGDTATTIVKESTPDISSELQKVSDAELSSYMDKVLDEHRAESLAIEGFKEAFERLLKKISEKTSATLPMYILIDELDRCRPSFAIELLERVKHLFGIRDTVFVVATDSRQLQHSICAVYGAGFDSSAYLRRFFNKRYEFPTTDRLKFINFLFSQLGENRKKLITPSGMSPEDVFKIMANANELKLRDIEQCYSILDSALRIWDQEFGLQMLYFLALIIAFHQQDDELVAYLKDKNSAVGAKAFERYKNLVLYRKRRGEGHPQEVLCDSFLRKYIEQSCKPFPISDEFQGIPEDWVLDQFQNEFQLRFRGGYSTENRPYSIMKKYPDMVASALQFTD